MTSSVRSEEIFYASARSMLARIATGELSSVALTTTTLARIGELNPELNALNLVRPAALDDARRADAAVRAGERLGKLHGLPITIKDTFRVAGVRSTFGGVPQYARYTPASDCTLVSRLRRAGAIIVGRSNTPLLALDWQCGNPLFGTSKNPHDPSRTPGGSSGGSAAALAAGFTALELGSDLGGSIRYPAHCCGVFGLRPTEHVLPFSDIGPEDTGEVFTHNAVAGPMARSLDDLKLMWDVLRDRADTGVAPDRPLKLALTMQAMGVGADSETRDAIGGLVRALRRDGHQVTELPPPIDVHALYRLNFFISGYSLARVLPRGLDRPPLRTLFELYLFRFKTGDGPLTTYMRQGLAASAEDYADAVNELLRHRAAFARFFDTYDAWLLPVAPTAALGRQAYGHAFLVDDRRVAYSLGLGAFTVATAALGVPALSLPIGRGATSGMPIGVQLLGRAHGDDDLIAMAETAFGRYAAFVPPSARGPSPSRPT